MTQNSSSRQRISTDFAIQIVVISVISIFMTLAVANDFLHREFSSTTAGLLLAMLLAILLIRFLVTRPKIDYDFAEHILYIAAQKGQLEQEVPVKQIDKILFSIFGFGRGSQSYVIKYRDQSGSEQKIRLFTRMFDNSVTTLIKDTKAENHNLVTRNWSFGFNELFD